MGNNHSCTYMKRIREDDKNQTTRDNEKINLIDDTTKAY